MLTRHGSWVRLEMFLPEAAYSPIGFSAGDTNLFRYVGNAPTNATDPSGLAPESAVVTAARADLAKEIERWRSKGWVYPANLLQHFLDNSGKDHEITETNPLNKDEIAQVKAEAHAPLKQFIGNWLANNKDIKRVDGEKITIPKTHLRFFPDLSESQFGNLHAALKDLTANDIHYCNNILFYAWYGVDVEIEGKIKFDVKVVVPVRDDEMAAPKSKFREYISQRQYSFIATKIKFTDSFDFPDGVRNLHPLIGAARELVKVGYVQFKVTATYSDYFSPFVK